MLHRLAALFLVGCLWSGFARGAEPAQATNPSRPVTVVLEISTHTEAHALRFMKLASSKGFQTTLTITATSASPSKSWVVSATRTSVIAQQVLSEQLAEFSRAGSGEGATMSYKVSQTLP